MTGSRLTDDQRRRLREVAVELIPGGATSPPVADVPEFDRLLDEAATALGVGFSALRDALHALPADISWESLRQAAAEDPASFEQVAAVVAGAYFMAPDVLASLGYPTGPRSAAPFDLAADEIASGILEPVLAGGSRVRWPDRPNKEEA